MGATLTYFRLHRWQRRLLSILVAVALGLGGAVVLRPVFREYYLIRDLGSRDLAVRNAAINRAAILARQYPHVLDRLNRELAAADDVKFQAITRVLEFLGVFRVPGRDPNQLDRLRLIEFTLTRADANAARVTTATSRGATSRGATTTAATSTSSPLAASQTTSAVTSRAAASRAAAATQAAANRVAIAAETRLFLFQDAVFTGRDNLYTRRLLAAAARDESPAIRQAACVLATRFADGNTLLQLLNDPDPNVVEWAAIDAKIGKALSKDEIVNNLIQHGHYFRGIEVAGSQATSRHYHTATRLYFSHLSNSWSGQNAAFLVTAAKMLGTLVEFTDPDDPNAPSREERIEILREAALFDAGSDPNEPEFALAVPAAAAAVALWLREPSASFLASASGGAGEDANSNAAAVDPNSTAYLIYHTASSEHQLAGDYIAWHLSRADGSARAKAFQLGMNLLPPPIDPRDANTRRGFRNYSAPSRATAAMLMALAARTPQEKAQAKARIASRLDGGPLRAPSDFYEVSTYKCALLILGETRYRGEVAALLDSGAFPVRRAITALCAAGDRAGLDWLLWDLRAGTAEIGEIIVGTRLGEVLSVLAPELPAVDEAAGDDLRNWQVRILQDYYRIHREKIRFAPAN